MLELFEGFDEILSTEQAPEECLISVTLPGDKISKQSDDYEFSILNVVNVFFVRMIEGLFQLGFFLCLPKFK